MRLFDGKSVLVTGGTGSFGSRFVSTLLQRHAPRRVIVFSRDELKQHEMRQHGGWSDDHRRKLRFFIGDVRDAARLRMAMDDVQIVVHAAALKQVPACEYNPFEAIRTNVLGAQNIIEAAISCGVERLIAMSTDKACNPLNLYGATKLCSDKLFVAGNAYAGGKKTRFAVVRYGNVVGSRGSVIPLFLHQRKTGRITITDRRMTRFWITLQQGVDFVLASLERMHGGELYVPKIPSARVSDLATAIGPKCSIDEIGIRPGEKLHEVMISSDDARHTLEFDDHYIIAPQFPWWDENINGYGSAARVGEGFEYSSNKNKHWLTVEQIRKLAFDGPYSQQ